MILGPEGLAPTPPELMPLEEETLASLAGTSMVWNGRAATSLYWAYRLARRFRDLSDAAEVIVPAISCATPATVALPAGCRVRFADVDRCTGMITLDTVRERWTPATRAIVFIYLYGQTADVRPLAEWCKEKGVLLIEDLAQAQGAMLPGGEPAGSVGDISVYSFNRTKILDCGGGAMVLRRSDLAEFWRELMREEESCAEIDPVTAAALGVSQRDLYQSMVALRRLDYPSDVSAAFLSVESAYHGLYRRSMKNPAALANAWKELPAILDERRKKADVYSRKLAGGPWRLLDGWRESGVCWRYPVRIRFPESVALTERVRRDGFFVSNLYWPLSHLMNPRDECPNAEWFAQRILNLFVDNTVALDRVEQCCESLWRHSAGFAVEA